MNYYDEIRNKILDNEIYSKAKEYSKEKYMVITYFEIGRLLYEAGSKYGESIVIKYSQKLVAEVGKKYNYRTLYRMRKLYIVFSNEKLTPLVSKLSWSHYLQLLSLKDENEIIYYINLTIKEKLTKLQLREKVKNNEYKDYQKKLGTKLINKEQSTILDLVPNPILIKNTMNYTNISEKILKQLILENIDNFLLELGSSFSYVRNEYKIKIGDRYNYIDLLLYNIEFNAYVVIELKVTELKKEHIGQIEIYMNYIDSHLKRINQEKTIGIIICRKDNKFIMEYCSDKRILSREYQFI